MIEIIRLGKKEEDRFIKKLNNRNNMVGEEVAERVAQIVEKVKKEGDLALFHYTKKFDGVEFTRKTIEVKKSEIDEAYHLIDKNLLNIIRRAKQNIERFYSNQKENSWITTEEEGVILGQIARPLERIGVYVPGGTAPLISSVLMNIVPAKVAGINKITMVTPPGEGGKINPNILVAASEAGANNIYKVGGSQAVAALAFGTQSIQKVDKIFGPGNIYVTTAKRIVYGYCDIDMFAGPSEIVVLADENAKPEYVAADLLSQAEHDILSSSILVTTSETLAQDVKKEIQKQYLNLERKEIIEKSLQDFGAIIIVECIKGAIDVINNIAPEHLELCIDEPFDILGSIKNAGAIFLGHYSSEPIGDYWAGPSHVLPTGGTARYFSCLNINDFMKKSSIISYSRKALRKSGDDIINFALAEGLTAHANAIKIRLKSSEEI